MDLQDKIMTDKFMYIPNNDKQNYPFCRLKLVVETLYNQLNEPNNQNQIKIPKFVKPTNKKTLL